ncbi:hypothetical protein M0D69_01735 [Caballeronia sp. SEWSISQ10-4 2]|uniref:hypothetical protein n=1 Tax=Caballeronia sp. SEWSISQ10-4 2 TaxID=2937438 RepID=UPI0026527240|nr:hypothetical protein [Caballeronia sp. SEWSISQ10-4 2]MDN7176761.1 hypothetical protein [Caballeronia sp. SEWSISQ10-4 2]
MTALRRIRPLIVATLLLFTTVPRVFAQEADSSTGPIRTIGGSVLFVQQGNGFEAQIDGKPFDRLNAGRIAHFDEPSGTRMIVEAFDSGAPELVLYDFSKRPPAVERIGRRMKLTGVFWQGNEVVLKSADGWFRFQRGTLTKLVSSKMIYH